MSTKKRKHITLTIKDKQTIIERLDQGENQNMLAEEYGVGRATIYDINKNRTKIQIFGCTTDSGRGNRQTLRKAGNPEVEKALYTWFLQEKKRNAPISGPLLALKAKIFYERITGKNDFSASKGWLDRFKSRHGIRLMSNTVKNANDTTCIEEFQARFLQKIADLNLCPSQVYNADESELCWRVIPNKTSVLGEKTSVSSRKVSKERINFLPCANASGLHALKLLVVGKLQKPQSFKNIDLPVHYFGEKSSCITREMFKKWFDDCFVPEVRKWLEEHNLPQKALLLLDNAPSHPSEEELTTADKSIITMFIPPNSAPLIQPMDQNIIQYVKRNYKKNILLTAVSNSHFIEKTLREFNMKDMVFHLTNSWGSLQASMIASSWIYLWPGMHSIWNSLEPQEDTSQNCPSALLENISSATELPMNELQTWYEGIHEQEPGAQHLTKEEIIQIVSSTMTEENDGDPPITVSSVSSEDASKSFEICLQWAEENGYSCSEMLLLRRMRDKALICEYQKLNQ